MPLTPAQRERLQKYRRTGDRGREPLFVGRGDLFTLVADNADAAARGDVEGRTVCIAGPPGIGKTAFLGELAERSRSADGWGGPPTACVSVSPVDLPSPPRVLAAIAAQLPKEWRPSLDAMKGALKRLSGVDVGIGAGGFTFSASASWQEKPMDSPTMPWAELTEAIARMPTGAAICLLIDEAHTLRNTPGEERNVLLQSLHMGPPPMGDGAPPPPVFAVLAGHIQTPEVLEASVSQRYATGNLRYMGNLSKDESLSYVLGTLPHLQGDGPDPGRNAVARWVVGECGGFPHHLRNAMESLAEGILRADSTLLADLDGGFVADDLGGRRELYYEARAKGAIALAGPEVGALLRDWSQRSAPVDERQGLLELSKLLAGLPKAVRGGMARQGVGDGRALMAEMVRRGALMTDRAGGGCRCPIGSLSGWLENQEHVVQAPFPNLAGRQTPPGDASPAP